MAFWNGRGGGFKPQVLGRDTAGRGTVERKALQAPGLPG